MGDVGRGAGRWVVVAVVTGGLAWLGVAGPAVAATWGKAVKVPGTPEQSQVELAVSSSVSCASVGNCAAGGYYRDRSGHDQAYVVSQVNGTWGKAVQLPGAAVLNARGDAEVESVSCARTGYCAAGGFYTDRSGRVQAFIASRVMGRWAKTIQVPGTAALAMRGGRAEVNSVSCPSAGNCGAGGDYVDSSGTGQAFVVSQVKGTWGKAIQGPGTALSGAGATVDSVSCSSAGNCAAGGYHDDQYGNIFQGFVVSLVKGKWGQAVQVPGVSEAYDSEVYRVSCASAGNCAAVGNVLVSEVNGTWGKPVPMLVPGAAEDFLTSVSCPSAGNCSAAGYYTDDLSKDQVFVVSQVNGRWGKPLEVPGTAALNGGGFAGVSSVSCPSAGNCAAAGDYADYAGDERAFVVSQVKSRWNQAVQVPGTALAGAEHATVNAVSCSSAGNCSAGGYFSDSAGRWKALVVSQVNGRWGRAIQVPGTAALGARVYAAVTSVSCASAGNCAAAGYYIDRSGRRQAFLVSQVKGRWGKAIRVPGTAALGTGGYAVVSSVSCASAGNCAAGGYSSDSAGSLRALVVSQVNGRWGRAVQVPGTATLGTGRHATVTSVSCPSAGNCAAVGDYADHSGHGQVFLVSQVKGTWGKAIQVPGTATLNKGGHAEVSSVSCPSAGNCAAAGYYRGLHGDHLVFVVSQVNGTWGKAIKVPAPTKFGGGWSAVVNSVSCASAGNCAVAGNYATNGRGWQAFVVSQVKGTWGKAILVPGLAALNTAGFATVYSVSCPSAGNCSAGGYYSGVLSDQAFVVSQVKGRWGKAIQVPGTAALNAGDEAIVNSVSCASAGNCAAAGNYRDRAGNDRAFVVSQVKGRWGKAIQVPGTGAGG